MNPLRNLEYKHPVRTLLNNNTPVYHINTGSQEVLKIEFIFKAGQYVQPKKLVSSISNKMLSLGTESYSAYDIAEQIDTYGAYLDTHIDKDYASVSMYCLSKHFETLLPVLHEVICKPIFTDNEFNTLINKTKQEHAINLEKIKYLARIHFYTALFSENHPYGLKLDFNDFDSLSINDIKSFYHNYYALNNAQIIISGRFSHDINDLLNKYFNSTTEDPIPIPKKFKFIPPQNYQTKVFKEGALQSAIRIGKPIFRRNHPDFIKLYILNTVLGGYFGSRLMSNIREDKGYTYGISSAITAFYHHSFFSISTEVGSEYTQAAIEEIYKELKLLRTKIISDSELSLVKNYLCGQIIRSLDGPFALGDRVKMIIKYDLSFDYFRHFVKEIEKTTPQMLIDLANKHFHKDSMVELVVGS